MAYFSYRRYYPSLQSPRCDEPFPSRAEFAIANGGGRGKLKDEEARIRGAADFSVGDEFEDEEETLPLNDLDRDRDRSRQRGEGD